MKSIFGRVVLGSVLVGFILVSGNTASAWGMTSSTSKATKKQQSKKWKNKATKITKEQREKLVDKVFDYTPNGKLIKESIKVGVWANKKKLKNTGVGALTSGTTKNCKKNKK